MKITIFSDVTRLQYEYIRVSEYTEMSMDIPSIDELTLLHNNMCHAVGDPKRIQILYVLSEQPQSVNMLATALDSPQPTISRHLAILRERGLVLADRDGTSMIYRLTDTRIIDVLNIMRQMMRETLERRTQAIR
jgi:DNA-binding transcriptional ArsR family regulator